MLEATFVMCEIEAMLRGLRDSTTGVARNLGHLAVFMSDAAEVHWRAMAEVFFCTSRMCFFHVKLAAKYNRFHRSSGTKERAQQVWRGASADMDIARAAHVTADFQFRCSAIRTNWESEGLCTATT